MKTPRAQDSTVRAYLVPTGYWQARGQDKARILADFWIMEKRFGEGPFNPMESKSVLFPERFLHFRHTKELGRP